MKKLIWIVLLVLLVVGYLWWVGAAPFNQVTTVQKVETTMEKEAVTEQLDAGSEMKKPVVEIKNFSFSPVTLTVKAGTTVTFTNRDSVGHSATADDGKSFDTGLLGKDESGDITFDTPGTYAYHCTPHPNMKATVVVE